MGTVKDRHRETSATEHTARRSFSGGDYLRSLMVELDRAAISRRIATARVQAGLTQPELADALDPPVHWRTVQTWESGERNKKTKEKTWSPPFRRLGQIAEVTGKSKEWLLHGDRPNEDDIAARLARIEQALEELVARSGQAEPSEQAKRPLGQ